MVFDVQKAEKIVASTPHDTHVAPKEFLEGFVGRVEDDKEDATSFNLFNVGINKEHLKQVDITKPGIVAVITYKADKKQGETKGHILIDGNHRAKKSLQEGREFKVYVLTPKETWEVMSKRTPRFLLKNLVNPTVRKR